MFLEKEEIMELYSKDELIQLLTDMESKQNKTVEDFKTMDCIEEILEKRTENGWYRDGVCWSCEPLPRLRIRKWFTEVIFSFSTKSAASENKEI